MLHHFFTSTAKTVFLTAISLGLLLPLGAKGEIATKNQDKAKQTHSCQGTLNDSKTQMVLQDSIPTAQCSANKTGACDIIFITKPKVVATKTGQNTKPKATQNDTKALSLTFSRISPKAKWDIYLTLKTVIKDPERLSITVDNNEPMEVSTEFLFQKPNMPNRVYIDQRLTRVVVNEIQSGKTATVTLTYNNVKTMTETFDKTSFKNVKPAFAWVDCMMLMR